MKLWLWLLVLVPAGAIEIRGVIEDGTRGGDGTAQVVNLVQPGQAGMQVLATLTDVTGAFSFDYEGELSGMPILIQAIKDGVTYSQARIDPAQTNVVRVFQADPEAEVQIQMGYVGVYAYEDKVELLHFYYLDNVNSPPKTKMGPDPTVRLRVAEGYTAIESSIQRGTMPLRQPISVEDGFATTSFAVHPGRTTFVVRYTFDTVSELAIPLLENTETGRLVLMPRSMDLESAQVAFVEEDPTNNLKLYSFAVPGDTDTLKISLSGTPDPVRGQASAQSDGGQQQTQQTQQSQQAAGGRVENRPNPLDKFRWAIIGTVLGLLGLTSILAWRR